MRIFFAFLSVFLFAAVPVVQLSYASDDPSFSDYLDDDDRKAFVDDEMNKMLNDGAVNLSTQEELYDQADELQQRLDENGNLIEEEKPTVTYRYNKKETLDPEKLTPRLWVKPR